MPHGLLALRAKLPLLVNLLSKIINNITTTPLNMAAAVKALNAKIRSNPTLDYFCSTRTFRNLLRACQLGNEESDRHHRLTPHEQDDKLQ
jgi:hypothetical protein